MRLSLYGVTLLMLLMALTLSAFNTLPVGMSLGQDFVGVIHPAWNITRGGPRGDEGWSVAVDDKGNVYFAGFDRISGATANVFLRKFTPDGVELWNVSWGGAFDDEAFILTVYNEFVYVGGRTFKSFLLASADMFVLKFHALNGSLVWSQTWDGRGGYDEVDGLFADGNSLYVAGWTTGASTQLDMAILKYDINGTLIWGRCWGTNGVDEANGQIGVDEKYVYVVGHYNALPLGLGGDAVLVAFNKNDGSYAWHRTWGGTGLDDAFGMSMDSKYIYSVGITNSFGGDLIFLLKYDKTGSLIWNATWGGKKSELARTVAISKDGKSIYIAGNTMSYGSGDFDLVLLVYDQDGNLLSSKTWGGPLLDQSHGMIVDDLFVYIAGETKSYGAGNEDAFLLKVDVGGGQASFKLGNLIVKPSSVEVGGSLTISVDVTNVGGRSGTHNVTLKIDGKVKEEKTVTLRPGENKTMSFSVSASQQGTFSVDVNGLTGTYTVKKKGCVIATATFGSELSPEVQFLRYFRDNIVLNTFAGKNFMSVFDAWYYSFSPAIAPFIAQQPIVKEITKVILYPLIGILHLSYETYVLFSFHQELGIVMAGLVASSLIGVIYFSIIAIMLIALTNWFKRKTLIRDILKMMVALWLLSVGMMVVGESTRSYALMMASTALFVLVNLSTSVLIIGTKTAQRLKT